MNLTQQWNDFLDDVEKIVQSMSDPLPVTYITGLRSAAPESETDLKWSKDYVLFNTYAMKLIDTMVVTNRNADAILLGGMMNEFSALMLMLKMEPSNGEFTKTVTF